MKTNVFMPTLAIALMIGSGAALAQNQDKAAGNQPASTQSAPAESPDASGHDAQTSKPETGPSAMQQEKEKQHQKGDKAVSKKGDRQ